jgi:hypothetical protein
MPKPKPEFPTDNSLPEFIGIDVQDSKIESKQIAEGEAQPQYIQQTNRHPESGNLVRRDGETIEQKENQ